MAESISQPIAPQAAPLEAPDRRRAFFGWRMVAVAFLVDFVAVGFFFYSYGVFFKALAADFGGSRLAVSIGITLANVVGAVISPFLGRLLDRYPIRRIMTAGVLSVATGFVLLSQIGGLWQFYFLLATLVAVGTSCMGGLSSAKLVTNWFVERTGTALGYATMGISLSGLVMPVVATWLIDEIGWRGGFAVYGVATLLLVLPVVRSVVGRPEDVGLLPDGGASARGNAYRATADEGWSTRNIARSADFWCISLTFGLLFCALSAVLTHLIPHVTDLGLSPYRAATVLSIGAGAGALGKVAFGILFDRLDARHAVWISIGSQLAGLLLLMRGEAYPALLTAAAIFGFGMGGAVPLQGALVARTFGRAGFGKVMGLMRPVMLPLHMAGIPFAGWVYDNTGSYDAAFVCFAAMQGLAVLSIGALRLRRDPVHAS